MAAGRFLGAAFALAALPAAAEVRWVGASAVNAAVELSVFDLELTSVPGAPGRLSVAVATGWRNLLPAERMGEVEWMTEGLGGLASFGRARPPEGRESLRHAAYLVPRPADHLLLVHAGGAAAPAPAETEAEDPEAEIRLERRDDEAERVFRFEIGAEEAGALLLVFLDFDHGHVEVPLAGAHPDPEAAPARAEARTDLRRARRRGVRAGADGAEVELGLTSLAEGAAVEVDLSEAVALRLADGGTAAPDPASAPQWLDQPARIPPLWESRARLAFPDAEAGAAVALEIAPPGAAPLRLALRPEAPAPPPPPAAAALAAWEDGEGLRLELVGLEADPRARRLALRVRVVNDGGADLEFAPEAQFVLVADGRETPPEAAPESWEVRDGARRELTLRYALRRWPARATLRYLGFEADGSIPLELPRR